MGRSSFLKGVNLLVHILYLISTYCSFCDTAALLCQLQNSKKVCFVIPGKIVRLGFRELFSGKGIVPQKSFNRVQDKKWKLVLKISALSVWIRSHLHSGKEIEILIDLMGSFHLTEKQDAQSLLLYGVVQVQLNDSS